MLSSDAAASGKLPEALMKYVEIRLQQNNFDLLRFLFAFVVFLVHAYVLSGSESLSMLNMLLSSDIAEKSLFVVSGFLIFMSYGNSCNIKNYYVAANNG